MVFLAIGGVLVMMVGFLPWDLFPEAHGAVALTQAVAQWVGMIILAFALHGRALARGSAALTIVSLLISMIGFVLFIDAISGGPSTALGLGIIERIAFDTLTIWGAAVGFILLATTRSTRSTPKIADTFEAPAGR